MELELAPSSFAFTEAPLPAIVVFARADGTLALWDPCRNHHSLRPSGRVGVLDTETAADPATVRRPPAFIFNPDEVFNSKTVGGKTSATASSPTGPPGP